MADDWSAANDGGLYVLFDDSRVSNTQLLYMTM